MGCPGCIVLCLGFSCFFVAFIRLFDKNSHDIAKTSHEIRTFKEVMRTLFDQGGVFSSRDNDQNIGQTNLPAIGGYVGAVGVKPMFR